jgi:hypothetical protein
VPASTSRIQLTRWHRILIAIVVLGAAVVAGIGFSGSYAAVSDLARAKGFGAFAAWFPIGVDAAIVMLLALDVLLDWLGMQLLLLRYAAWFLSGATVAFNAAAAAGDPVAMAMHATIPVSFLAAVEAARRAISRLAGLSEHRPMDSVRLARWFLAPRSTLLLWRRMKLWELTSYSRTIKREQERMLYRARLRSRFGWRWHWAAPVEARMPLKMVRYGIPIRESLTPETAQLLGLDPQTLLAIGTTLAPAPRHPALGPTGTPAAPAPQEHTLEMELSPSGVVPPPATTTDADGTKHLAPDAPDEQQTAVDEERGEQQADPGSESAEAGGSQESSTPWERDEDQVKTLATMRPADAIRYAIAVLNTFDHAQLVEWLKLHGKTVNRGQAFRVAEAAEKNNGKQPDPGEQHATEAHRLQQAAA